MRAATQQGADAQQGDDIVEADGAGGRSAQPVAQVFVHGQMRKQAGVLEHQAGAAGFRRNPEAGGRVGQDVIVQHDTTGVGPQQPGNGGDDGGFPRAGRAENRRQAGGGGLERRVDGGVGELVAEVDLEGQRTALPPKIILALGLCDAAAGTMKMP